MSEYGSERADHKLDMAWREVSKSEKAKPAKKYKPGKNKLLLGAKKLRGAAQQVISANGQLIELLEPIVRLLELAEPLMQSYKHRARDRIADLNRYNERLLAMARSREIEEMEWMQPKKKTGPLA